jgi:diguanylate cyclase (GGDEF)-like protein
VPPNASIRDPGEEVATTWGLACKTCLRAYLKPCGIRRVMVPREGMVTTDRRATTADDDAATELVRQRDTSEMLLSVASALCEPTDVPAVSQIVAGAVPTVCQSDRGAVVLWDEATNHFVISGFAGWPDDLAAKVAEWVGSPFESDELKGFLEHGDVQLLTAETSDWSRGLVETFMLRAIAAVPIAVSGRFMGLVVAHWAESDPPEHLDETLTGRLTGLAALAGVALDNNRLVQEVTWNTHHDPLTRLPNRLALEEGVARMVRMADATRSSVVVVVGDVDRFKRLNDRLGHAAGDTVLREVSERLRQASHAGDIVARYGGDEFAIAFGQSLPHDVGPSMARIERLFKRPIRVGDQDVVLSLTLGFAMLHDVDPDGTPEDRGQRLTALAESDLVRRSAARRALRGTSDDEDELALDTDLHGAVARGEIVIHYQPQTDIASGRIVAVEALARWEHPTRGLVPPDRFIALAEENGTIGEIGEHVLRSACHDITLWRDAGHDIEVSVNASVVQLDSPGFAASVAHVLQTLGLPPDVLTIEVTETKVVTDMSTAQSELRAIGELGVGIAIDDFGTGFSSLTQISNLPVTELKIDRSFVDGMLDGGEKIVAAVIGLGRGLGLQVVAEGVETQAQLDALTRLGCDRAQGYLISRPVPAAQLLAVLERA